MAQKSLKAESFISNKEPEYGLSVLDNAPWYCNLKRLWILLVLSFPFVFLLIFSSTLTTSYIILVDSIYVSLPSVILLALKPKWGFSFSYFVSIIGCIMVGFTTIGMAYSEPEMIALFAFVIYMTYLSHFSKKFYELNGNYKVNSLLYSLIKRDKSLLGCLRNLYPQKKNNQNERKEYDIIFIDRGITIKSSRVKEGDYIIPPDDLPSYVAVDGTYEFYGWAGFDITQKAYESTTFVAEYRKIAVDNSSNINDGVGKEDSLSVIIDTIVDEEVTNVNSIEMEEINDGILDHVAKFPKEDTSISKDNGNQCLGSEELNATITEDDYDLDDNPDNCNGYCESKSNLFSVDVAGITIDNCESSDNSCIYRDIFNDTYGAEDVENLPEEIIDKIEEATYYEEELDAEDKDECCDSDCIVSFVDGLSTVYVSSMTRGEMFELPDDLTHYAKDDKSFKGWIGYSDGMIIDSDCIFYAERDESVVNYYDDFDDIDEIYDEDNPSEEIIDKIEEATYYEEELDAEDKDECCDSDCIVSFVDGLSTVYVFSISQGKTLEKLPNDIVDYAIGNESFKGWVGYSDGMIIDSDCIFYAEYDYKITDHPSPIMHHVSFYDGYDLIYECLIEDGHSLSLPLEVEEYTLENNYYIKGWSGFENNMVINRDITLNSIIKKKCHINFVSEKKTISSYYLFEGNEIVLPSNPSDYENNARIKTFSGWRGYKKGMVASGDITFQAIYDSYIKEYTVEFIDKGECIDSKKLPFDALIHLPKDPDSYKDEEGTIRYFKNWSGYKQKMRVTSNHSFIAEYTDPKSPSDGYHKISFRYLEKDLTVLYQIHGSKIVIPDNIPDCVEYNGKQYRIVGWKGFYDNLLAYSDMIFEAKLSEVIPITEYDGISNNISFSENNKELETSTDLEELLWTYDASSRTLIIAGNGPIKGYLSNSAPWKNITCTTLIIGEGITKIGNFAFEHNKRIEKIILPSTVELISNFAFYGCNNLNEIKINSDNSSYITYDGILYDKKHNSILHVPAAISGAIKIYPGLKRIESKSFGNHRHIKKITIPDSVEFIEDRAFNGCVNLSELVLPDGLEYHSRNVKSDNIIEVKTEQPRNRITSVDTKPINPNKKRDSRGKLVFDLNKIEAERKNHSAVLELLETESDDEEAVQSDKNTNGENLSDIEFSKTMDSIDVVDSDDKWIVLNSRFSTIHRDYISCLLNHKPVDDLLKKANLMKSMLESEINSIAQEVIDDIIIEDNDIVEDYVDELTRVL